MGSIGGGNRNITSIGEQEQYEDMGFGKVKNPLTQIPLKTSLEAIAKIPSDYEEQGEYKEVDISSLVSSQDYLFKNKLDYMRKTGVDSETSRGTKDEILVTRYKGMNILQDGTHRVILEREKGKKKIRVKFYDVQ